MGERGQTLKPEGHGRGRVLSVGPGLIELEVGDGFWIRGIESGRLIESELRLGRGAAAVRVGRRLGRLEGHSGTAYPPPSRDVHLAHITSRPVGLGLLRFQVLTKSSAWNTPVATVELVAA